jgi:hypothetical protein
MELGSLTPSGSSLVTVLIKFCIKEKRPYHIHGWVVGLGDGAKRDLVEAAGHSIFDTQGQLVQPLCVVTYAVTIWITCYFHF